MADAVTVSKSLKVAAKNGKSGYPIQIHKISHSTRMNLKTPSNLQQENRTVRNNEKSGKQTEKWYAVSAERHPRRQTEKVRRMVEGVGFVLLNNSTDKHGQGLHHEQKNVSYTIVLRLGLPLDGLSDLSYCKALSDADRTTAFITEVLSI